MCVSVSKYNKYITRGGYVDDELLVNVIVDQEIVGHADAVRLHRVSRPVVVIADLLYCFVFCGVNYTGGDIIMGVRS